MISEEYIIFKAEDSELRMEVNFELDTVSLFISVYGVRFFSTEYAANNREDVSLIRLDRKLKDRYQCLTIEALLDAHHYEKLQELATQAEADRDDEAQIAKGEMR